MPPSTCTQRQPRPTIPQERPDAPIPQEERAHFLGEQLALASARLKEARKILRRDWEQLSPRERSEHSRRVRELEQEHAALLDEIEIAARA